MPHARTVPATGPPPPAAPHPLEGPSHPFEGLSYPLEGPSYPLELDLSGRTVLVVGGGAVASRHARRLAAMGADVLVVATQLCEDLADLVQSARARWLRRALSPDDLPGAWLVHAATGIAAEDAGVLALCDFARVWCVADGNPASPARRR